MAGTALTGNETDVATIDAFLKVITGETAATAVRLYTATDDPTAAPLFAPSAVRAAFNARIAGEVALSATPACVMMIPKGTHFYSDADGATYSGTTGEDLFAVCDSTQKGGKYDPTWHILNVHEGAASTALNGKYVKRDSVKPIRWPRSFVVVGG